jgi:hypothetical protein
VPTTSVRRRISLLSRSCGFVDQIWRQCSFGKPAKASLGAGLVEVRGGGGEALGELADHPPVLEAHLLGIRLGEDRAHERGHEGLGRLGHLREQVAEVVRFMPTSA